MGKSSGDHLPSFKRGWYLFCQSLLWMMSLSPASLFAAGNPDETSDMAYVNDVGSTSLKMIGSLLLIIGLILCLFYLLKRLRLGPSGSRSPEMRLIGTMNLAPKRSVAVVEVCGRWLVLGVGTENISLLSRFDGPPDLASTESNSMDTSKGFHAMLKNKILRNRGRGETGRGEHGIS